MAKKNVLFERDNFIGQLINRAGIAEVDIDGGMAVAEGSIVVGNDELYTLTPATADTKRVGIAFNPSVKYDNINGKLFPAKSLDDRDYTNLFYPYNLHLLDSHLNMHTLFQAYC